MEYILLGLGVVLTIFCAMLTTSVLRYLKVETERVKLELGKSVATNVVDYLEQAPAYRYALPENKKEQAFVLLGQILEGMKINFGYDDVDRFIEEAVYGQGDGEGSQEDRDEKVRGEG